ncbi:MAG: ATP-binding protein [Candidatus Aminicenantales bacterium]
MSPQSSSVRLRLTLWYSLVLAGTVLVLSLFVFFFVRAGLYRQLNRQLESDFKAFFQDFSEDPSETLEAEAENSAKIVQIVKAGTLLYRTPAYQKAGLPLSTTLPVAGNRTVPSASGARFLLKTGLLAPDVLLTAAVDEEPVRSTLQTLAVILMLALPIALALAAIGGFVMAGRLLRPVAAITARAEKISAESLSDRLPVENPRDEFGRLARVINHMLSRLEEAFERLRRFTADASHELRTPLTVIKSVGEVALQENLDAAAYRDRIGSMLEDVSRLTRLIENLLTLTRADSGRVPFRLIETDLARLVERAVEDMKPLAEEKEQILTMALEGPAIVRVDEALVRLALVNLLDNAIKYTSRSGTVTVGSKMRGNDFLIEVTDTGPGIAAEHKSQIFDRFYRVEKDRPGQDGGAGLGLSIAKWAVEANGGRIELETRESQGSTFRLVFPMAKSVKKNFNKHISKKGEFL